jgi:hypothetical protein
METVVHRARQLVGKVAVPRNLDKPHHLVAKPLAKVEGAPAKGG